ncbi:MAG: OmpA family protein [Paludibacteraceae bacterium]|nr:OmpA family protein [Paludibacteraceae bacterium]MBN2786775.1 OmpA family protein [Paludibacteraceae bacterium]
MKVLKLVILCCFVVTIAQAKDVFTKGDQFYSKGDYYLAMQEYSTIKPKIFEEKVQTQIRIARSYYQLNKMQEAYKTYYDYRDLLTGEDIYMYASALNKTGNYKEAIKWYYNVPKEIADSLNVKDMINSCRWAMRTTTSVPVELKPTRLSDLGQSFGIQYYKKGVVFSAPEEKNINAKKVDNHGMGFQNLYYSDLKNNEVGPTQKKFSSELKFPYHVGAVSFSHNYTRIYYTKTLRIKGNKSILKIFSSSYDSKTSDWVNETLLPFNSDLFNCAHPAVSPDNKYLYFTSDMPNGFGGKDLYRVTILDNKMYGKVENLGSDINTFGDEMFPFIGVDNTLYFSSNGYPGFGRLDVYKSVIKEGKWTEPENMMLPINSSYDDFAYIINPTDNKTGFISSDRGNTTDVIYAINIIKKAPLKLATVLENSNDGSPITDGKVTIIDANTGNEIATAVTDKFGAFEVSIPEQFREESFPLTIKIAQKDYESKELKIPASKIQDLNNRRVPLKPKNENLPKALSTNLLDIYDRSPISDKQVTLKDKNSDQFIGQATSDSLGAINIEIPNEFRKSDQDFNIELKESENYPKQNITVSMAELDYIKKKGIDLQPKKTEIPAYFSSKLTSIIDNKPLVNAKVSIKNIKTGEVIGKSVSDAQGNFDIEIPEKYKKDGEVFNIEVLDVPGYLDEKLDVSIYNIQKLKDRGIEMKPEDKFSVEVSSKLTTSFNGEPIVGAKVTIKDAITGEVIGEGISKEDGSFIIFISDVYKGVKDFIIEVKKGDEFTPKSILASVEDLKNLKKDGILMTPIFNDRMLDEINTMVIPHDRKKISQIGYLTMDKLAIYLKNNPNVVIKLNGHTDVRGERYDNLSVSQEMANTAKEYLISKGVKEENIIPRGYGDRYVINKCRRGQECSLTEHIQNNRVEVVVWRMLP